MKGTEMRETKLLLMLLGVVLTAGFAAIVSANSEPFTKKEITKVKEQAA